MTVKIAVSLPDHLVEDAKRAVETGVAPSVSAYVADALTQRGRVDTLAALLDEMDREHGKPSAADLAWADRVLGIT